MTLVMLRKGWLATFGRTVFDYQGHSGRRLTFEPGEPVELTDIELRGVANDIGKALLPVRVESNGKVTILDLSKRELQALAELAASELLPPPLVFTPLVDPTDAPQANQSDTSDEPTSEAQPEGNPETAVTGEGQPDGEAPATSEPPATDVPPLGEILKPAPVAQPAPKGKKK